MDALRELRGKCCSVYLLVILPHQSLAVARQGLGDADDTGVGNPASLVTWWCKPTTQEILSENITAPVYMDRHERRRAEREYHSWCR